MAMGENIFENMVENAEKRGAERERERVLSLIDAEIEDWKKNEIDHPLSYFGSNDAVTALEDLRKLIIESKE